MNRATFLSRLRTGLYGIDPEQVAEMTADYESHFSEGLAAGRSEEDIAAGLGDPDRLAREMRAEAGFRRWERERSMGSLAGVVMAFLGLVTLDVIIMIPLVITVVSILLGFAAASLGVFIGGVALLVVAVIPGLSWFVIPALGSVALALGGLGLLTGGLGAMALTWLAADFVARALVKYARLHFRLLNAASDEKETA